MHNKRQKKLMWKWRSVFLAVICIFLVPVTGLAQEDALSFHVQPEFPTSQLEDSTSYFDLNLNPGEKETLVLVLQNDKEEPIKVKVTPHTAYTNVNGVVEYGKDAEVPDPTLIHSLDSLIDSPEVIELAGKETKKVELTLTMPKESFEGIIAGGLRIEEVKEEEEQTDEGEGVAIKNEFSYVIGVVVSNTRSNVQPELDLLDVFASQLNYRNVFSATIQNFTPTFVNRLEVEAEVRLEGQDEILYTANQEQLQMAPNSHFEFPISLNGDRFVSGNYEVTMTARSGENEWTWKKKFTIEAEEARTLNRSDVTLESEINWWMIVAIVFILLLFGAIVYLLYQKKKREKEYQKKRERVMKKRQLKKGKNLDKKEGK